MGFGFADLWVEVGISVVWLGGRDLELWVGCVLCCVACCGLRVWVLCLTFTWVLRFVCGELLCGCGVVIVVFLVLIVVDF